jgi:hypothetical protein
MVRSQPRFPRVVSTFSTLLHLIDHFRNKRKLQLRGRIVTFAVMRMPPLGSASDLTTDVSPLC